MNRTQAIVAIMAGFLIVPACKEIGQDIFGETSGHSFTVGDQFVILHNGFRMGHVTWVAVQNWPRTSSAEDRLRDQRVTIGPGGGRLIRRADGASVPPDAEPRVYFFDGQKLTTFPIRMEEDDFINFHDERMKSYDDVLSFLRKYEVGPDAKGSR